jgi:hypothetical protein
MLLNKVLSQMRSGESISIQEIADRLFEDADTIKHALTIICRHDYCEQLTLHLNESDCNGCCAGSCASISGQGIKCWHLTYKGIKYLDKISK